MNHSFFPPPSIDPEQKLRPLERLQVYDSLMITAELWNVAHKYLRQRQNLHYQALHQPGIIYGLGVKPIPIPADVIRESRSDCWVEIQPGVAVDWEGNPIIVSEPITFFIRVPKASVENPPPAYLLISYRDPEELNAPRESAVVREYFRIDQKTELTNPGELELCRVRWSQGANSVVAPSDVLDPEVNQLDLRYRLRAQLHPQGIVRVGTVNASGSEIYNENWACLMRSVAVLYPNLVGDDAIARVELDIDASYSFLEQLKQYDILYLPPSLDSNLAMQQIHCLRYYLNAGGVILVEIPSDCPPPDYLVLLYDGRTQSQAPSWQTQLPRDHPIRNHPFLFAALPQLEQGAIEVWYRDGIILLKGELSAAWGLDERLSLPRSEIRTAQEFGINLLHFAWKRRELRQLLS
ncbi:DUF4159 domain-containing protein [Oscillatoria sp. FACHB-1406]|uniref:DUF4159 domain-containing protein n=1 Tax=Oscillatoria sp. FACHB-1406 TaxID=2692846 RepID=UPI0016868A38|nr:DUF4159 domain-containing protein [Oscillatoria sp. FACHB-1406]MBD2576483.1 hypothetical protein [Oscillatoria sp. FACHB-1406]